MVSDANSAGCTNCSIVMSSAFPLPSPDALDTAEEEHVMETALPSDANQLCPITDIDLIIHLPTTVDVLFH
jgi:hypothetical protein